MGRAPCCEKVGLKKGPWTPEEDEKLVAYIQDHGHGSWRALPHKAGLLRCGKSCRLRWANYLRPDIKRGKFSLQEEQTIIQLHALLGNRWSAIATHLPKRTDNEIKNYWNTHLKKRLVKMGIDPVTHKPQSESSSTSHVSHMAQWESARLEAESRLVRDSKLRANAAHIFSKSTAQGNTWTKLTAQQKFDKVSSHPCHWTSSFALPYEEERTSYLTLLQQAMCPSAQASKLLYDETKKIVATHKIHGLLNDANTSYTDEKKGIIDSRENPLEGLVIQSEEDSSLVHSAVSEPDGDDSHHHVLRSSDHEINSVDFKTNYDGFTTDMLMDLVIVPVPPTLSASASASVSTSTSTEDRSMVCVSAA
ncbi:hypothetical protein KI387_024168, partial [Taxus chinensis]